MKKLYYPNGYVLISKSRNKSQPVKVATIGKNGEKLNSSETLTTYANALKNILAALKANHGTYVNICDTFNKPESGFKLTAEGKKEYV